MPRRPVRARTPLTASPTSTPDSSRALVAYLTTSTIARSAIDACGPALLVTTIAVLGSATTGSYLVAALTAAAAAAGPIAGAMIDRSRSARTGFALALVVMIAGLTAVCLLIGRAPIAIVVACAVIAGLGYPTLTGAWSAQLPTFVTPDRLRAAYAKDAATYSMAAVVAPPVATALVVLAPTTPLWLVVALLVVTLAMLRVVPLRSTAHEYRSASLRSDVATGLRTMFGRPALRRSTLLTTISMIGYAAFFVAAPILAERSGNGLGFTGFILGTFAVGGLVSAAWFARRPVHRPDRAIIAGTVLSGAFLLAIGLAPSVPLLLVASFAMGASEPPLMSSMFQVRVRESPNHVQAQVFATSSSLRVAAFAVGTAACGALIGGGLAWVIEFGVALQGLALVVGVALGPRLPHRRHWLHRD